MSLLPPIEPEDLRDHGDPARIERIWSRVESTLADDQVTSAHASGPALSRGARSVAHASRRTAATRAGAALAIAASFAGGLFVRDAFFADPEPASPMVATYERSGGAPAQVYAAGSSTRSFALDNGVKLTLEAEGLMELEGDDARNPVFKLIRGKVAVDASEGRVSIRSGEATLRFDRAAATVAMLGPETIETSVSAGVVDITSPDEAVRHLSSADAAVRISTAKKVAAREDDTKTDRIDPARRAVPSSEPRDEVVAAIPEPTSAPVSVAPAPASWYEIYKTDRASEALRAVEQSGGLDALVNNAQSPSELLALEDLARIAGKGDVRIRALIRVADEFPASSAASVAARSLANLFEKQGDKEKAAFYNARLKGTAFEQDALCDQLRGQMSRDPLPPATLSLAQGYLVKYPEGNCRDLAQSIVDDAASAAKQPGKTTKSDEPPKEGDPKDAGTRGEPTDAARPDPAHPEPKP